MNVDQRGTAQHRSAQKPSSGLNIKKKKTRKKRESHALICRQKVKTRQEGGVTLGAQGVVSRSYKQMRQKTMSPLTRCRYST
jgi:hypothetical protein